jgi:signal transduction histidine kinase
MTARKEKGWYFVLDEPVRLLIVDDDPLFREFATVHLATPVAGIETAADGQEAWDKLRDGAFDLVMVDIEMPGLDGYGLVERIRSDPNLCFLPVVMVTGREDIASIDRAYECGATSFVTKPVNWRQLSHQLRYVLRMSRIEAQIRAARDRAEKTSTLKGALLSTVKHEFRTPLTSIIGFSQMMQEGTYGPLLPKYSEFAEFIASSGQRLLDTLVEMVNYAELVSDACELTEDDYRLDRLIKGTLEALPSSVLERGLPIVTEIDDGINVLCDRAQMIRMLRHLIENAVVHAGENIKVRAGLSASGDLTIEVADTGPGIPPEQLGACFEPFAQGDMSLTRKKDGLGLGLPIAKRVAELHGGRLEVRPGEPKGTIALVTLPATRVRQANPAHAAA